MKILKKALAAATSSVMAASMCIIDIGSLGTANAADMTAVELVEDMGQGWNLGNTFDCTNTWTNPLTPTAIETAWGNPETTEAMIKEIKKSGFNTVRIPITWYQMMSSDGSSINEDYVARIKKVLGYVLDNGMYAIINTHHDEDWIKSENNTTKFTNLWKAIAANFASYDEHLVFEGTNEVSFSTSAQQQTFNQAFVDTVRATGGNNAKRLLLVCAPSNNTSKLLNDFTAPTDSAKMIAVSCHYYEPPQFCVAKTTSTWGHQETWGSNADKTTLQNDFDKLETKFIKNGIPVIIGEYGVDTSTEGGKDKESMYAFLKEVATYALGKEGMCPVVWDMSVYNNGAGDMAYFNRSALSWYDSKIGEIFASAANSGGGSDTTKSDRININAADIAATDKNGKTYWQIDLKPYKEYGVNPESAVVNFTITQTDGTNTEMSGDIAASFNVKTDAGTLAYSNIDTVVGINDSTAVIDLKPDTFNIAWDDDGAVTETAAGVIDMDYLKLENWWTWCKSGEASITIDSVTLIFDGNIPVEGDQVTTTTETVTTTTTSTTTATETTTTTATTTSDPDVTTESYTGVYANAYLAGSVGSNSVWSATEAADTENMSEVDGNGTFEVQWNLAEGSETIDFLMLEIESIDEFDSYFTTDTFPNLTLTIDHFYIDGVEQTLADEPDAVNLRYFENTGKTRAYFRANWGANGGVDFGISGDTTVEKTIKVVFTINGTYKEGTSNVSSGDKIWGDADGNEELTISDIVMVLQYSANKAKYSLSDKALANCDVNADNVVDAKDAFIMQQIDAGVVTVAELPLK